MNIKKFLIYFVSSVLIVDIFYAIIVVALGIEMTFFMLFLSIGFSLLIIKFVEIIFGLGCNKKAKLISDKENCQAPLPWPPPPETLKQYEDRLHREYQEAKSIRIYYENNGLPIPTKWPPNL